MIFNTVDEFVEVGKYRKALRACLYVANEEGYLTDENFDKLEKFIEDNLPEDKVESYKIELIEEMYKLI